MTGKDDRFRLNPLTRYFSKNVEKDYREYRFGDDIRLYKSVLRFILPLLGFSFCFIAWKTGIHVVSPIAFSSWIVVILTLAVTVLILEKGMLSARQATKLRVTVFSICMCAIAVSLTVARPERLLHLAGIVYIMVFIVNVQNSSFVFKALMTTILGVFYATLAVERGIPVDPNFLTTMLCLLFFAVLALVHGYQVEVGNRRGYINDVLLEEQRKKSESLLHNILPRQIAQQLKDKPQDTYVEKFESVSVLFADIVGFTGMSASMDPSELVQTLNHLFSRFDIAARMFGAEKIKTIGDAYLAVAGLPTRCDDHAERIAGLALEIQSAVEKYSRLMGRKIEVKVGIATGPVVAGIIGLNKFQYDLWGATVNMASRLETNGQAGDILICENTKNRLKDVYAVSDAGAVNLKGLGPTNVWRIDGHIVPVTARSA